jgi:hypothetical protein
VEKGTGMDYPCDCDQPDTSLLRVVLIGEIVRAEEDVLYTLAEICETLGILQLVDADEGTPPPAPTPGERSRARLRRIK